MPDQPATGAERKKLSLDNLPAGLLAGLGLALTAGITLLFGLGRFGLTGPDEPRYAAIAWSMWRSGNYITPRLAGRIWLQKPVLYYWLAAAAFHLLGVGTAAARAPNSLLALATVAALAVWLAKRHSSRAGWLMAALGLTSAFIIGFGRAASTDMPLAAGMTFSLICAYEGLRAKNAVAGERWLLGAGAGLGLAVLAKGPVAGLLEGLVCLLWILAQRRRDGWRKILRPWPWVVFLAVAVPWYAALIWRHPRFFRYFFWRQNLERFASNRYHHLQPAWFYLPILAAAIFPWTGWLIPALADATRASRRGWRRWRARQAWTDEARESGPLRLWLALWTLTPVFFFSLSQSKLPSYILPAVPGCLAGLAVTAAERWDKFPRLALLATAALAGLIPIGVWSVPWILAPKAERPPLAWLWRQTPFWSMTAFLTAILLFWAWRRRTRLLTGVTVLLMALGVGLTLTRWGARMDRAASTRPLARAIAGQCGENYAAVRDAGAGTPPAACRLYGWRADRNLVYGLEFYRHARLAPLDRRRHWPRAGLLITRRRWTGELIAAALAHRRWPREAVAAPHGADWALVRITTRHGLKKAAHKTAQARSRPKQGWQP